MDRKRISVILDTENPNTIIPKTFLQGSADEELLITLQYDGIDFQVDPNVNVDLNFIYGVTQSVDSISFVGMCKLKKGDYGHDISVQDGKILVKISPYMTGYFGTCSLILKIYDDVITYNYGAMYEVRQNPAFDFSTISDKYIPADMLTMQNAPMLEFIDIYKSSITAMSEFKALPEGFMLYKKNGKILTLGIFLDENTNTIVMPYGIKITPNTLHLGSAVNIHENGGFVENQVNISGNKYLMLDYLNDQVSGTFKPMYWRRGPLNEGQTEPIIIQSDDTIKMDDVKRVYYGFEPNDMQVQNVYFDFRTAVTNFRMAVTANGVQCGFYPNEEAWNSGKGGFNLGTGKQRINLEPWFSSLVEYDIQFDFKADQQINMFGNGIIPFIAVDRNLITRIELATMEDMVVSGGGDSPGQIKAKLELLQGNDRLTHNAIRDLELFDINRKNKLDSITGGRFLGVFENLSSLQIAHPNGTIGDAATVTIPNRNLFYWSGTEWLDSGTGFIGDMIKSVYDPSNKHADVYSMGNFYETDTAKILTADERSKLASVENGAELNVQSDWEQSNNSLDDFIKNKPVIYNSFGGGHHLPTLITSITPASTYVKIPIPFVPWVTLKDFEFEQLGTKFVYTGATAAVGVILTLSASCNTNNTKLDVAIFKNGLTVAGLDASSDFTAAGKIQRLSLTGQIQLSENDTLEIYASSNNSGVSMVVQDVQLMIR